MFQKRRITTSLFALLLVLGAVGATAQGQHLYAVNFVCGFQASADGPNEYEPTVKVANYATKVDLFNYGMASATLNGTVHETGGSHWTASPAPFNMTAGSLTGGGATLIDCTDIEAAISGGVMPPPGKPFYTGVLTVRSSEPLIVWATKTTEVCAGLVQVDQAAVNDPDIIVFDENGVPILPGMAVPAAAPILFGCPPALAFDARYGGGGPIGPFSGPGGAVPPGLRSRQVIPSIGSDMIAEDLSVSHSLDFERVEGIFLP